MTQHKQAGGQPKTWGQDVPGPQGAAQHPAEGLAAPPGTAPQPTALQPKYLLHFRGHSVSLLNTLRAILNVLGGKFCELKKTELTSV